jgi:hypothetical protein
MTINNELRGRAEEYARRQGMTLGKNIGAGVHGIVFLTERQPGKVPTRIQSAIKIHLDEHPFVRERDVYQRLRQRGIESIRGCEVPQLLGFDDELWVLEMTVVTRPFVLDFAGAQLDRRYDFSDEVWADWHADKREQFGPRWPEVQAILTALEGMGIFMEDVNPGNISFGD